MTHFLQRSVLQRSALILLATSALCVTPALAKTHAHHHHKAAAAPAGANGKIVTLADERESYVVKKGDTLEKIADKLNTTVAELSSVNKLKKANVLQPGQVLKGPAVTRKAYVVARGDTVFSIAKRFHVSVEDLREVNGLSAKASIHSGQKIRLPAGYKAAPGEAADETPDKAEAAPAKGRKGKAAAAEVFEEAGAGEHAAGRITTVEGKGASYKVRKGDTLAKIADKLDTDVAEVKRLNHIKGTAVRAGQVYRGPSVAEHVYTAAAGDTVAGVAQRFGVSAQRLRSANRLSKRTVSLRSGQKIHLPSGYREQSAPAPARPSRSYPQPPSRESGALPSRPLPYVPSGQVPRPYIPPPSAGAEATPAPGPTDAQISQMGKDRFQWPIRGDIVSDFGPKAGGQRNDGINIQADAGAVVRAAAEGDVVYAGDQVPGFGNLVLIKHTDGWVTAYAHLSHIDVKNQQKITQGQQIGQVGNTGGVPSPQLHFEVRYAPKPQDSRARPVDPRLVRPK